MAISAGAGSSPPGVCDLLVVGAGPAGLAAWFYGASELAVTGLFVFIGATPGTGWLAGQLAEDSHGFLLTGNDIPAARLEDQNLTPLFLETSRPGIFAAGDVRSGSVKRVAAAIGDGSVAVRLAYERLQSAATADPIGLLAR